MDWPRKLDLRPQWPIEPGLRKNRLIKSNTWRAIYLCKIEFLYALALT